MAELRSRESLAKPGLSPELLLYLICVLYGALIGGGIVALVWWLS